ncbi:MAG: transcription termination/antitermination protein NusA [Planctomycetes bacterium]|nr:transcription termination/antitermination protein NusA [Planctomycetota bacterium]
MNGELLRLVDSLHRDKNIDKELVFEGIEAALLSAARKQFGADESLIIEIDRETGNITATEGGKPIAPAELGRIAAQTAKQVMIQKIREAERDVIYDDYDKKHHTIVNGTVQRMEGPNLIVNLGRTEAILPRSEQIQNESYHPGERIRATVLVTEKVGNRVRIVLSRTSPELVRRLFELEVPEIAEKTLEIKGIAREPGFRTKIAVDSKDAKVDPVGACVGVRGSRIRSIVDELNGEKIDIIRWDESEEMFICNALKPAEIAGIILDDDARKATVIVAEDQLSLAIGKRGQNVRLSSKLSGWDIDITSQDQLDAEQARVLAGEEPLPETGAAPAEQTPAEGAAEPPEQPAAEAETTPAEAPPEGEAEQPAAEEKAEPPEQDAAEGEAAPPQQPAAEPQAENPAPSETETGQDPAANSENNEPSPDEASETPEEDSGKSKTEA